MNHKNDANHPTIQRSFIQDSKEARKANIKTS